MIRQNPLVLSVLSSQFSDNGGFMDIQYVFGNPKKVVARSKKPAKIKKKGDKTVKRKAVKKHNPKRHAHKSRKNPARFKGMAMGKLPKYTHAFPTVSELTPVKAKLSALRKQFSSLAKEKVVRKPGETNKQFAARVRAKKAKLAPAKRRAKAAIAGLKRAKKAYLSAKELKAQMIAKGYQVSPELTDIRGKKRKSVMGEGVGMGKKAKKRSAKRGKKRGKKLTKKQLRAMRLRNLAKARKARGKGKSRKTKRTKRYGKHPVRKTGVRRIKRTKRTKRTKRSSKRRAHKRVRRVKAYRSLKAKRSIRFQVKQKGAKRGIKFLLRRLNPMNDMVRKIESKIGIPLAELGGLAVGGALYGMVNKLFLKIPGLNTAWASALKIKYVGSILVPAIPNLALGIAASIVGRKRKMKLLEDVGHGMIGSAVVGMGVASSQELFGGLLGVSGVQYTPLSGVPYGMRGIPSGLGEENVSDYQPQLGDGADFGGVEFTPMSGVDYTPASHTSDFGAADPDFGIVPEGLGDGQMG